jgi:hypothetical protein
MFRRIEEDVISQAELRKGAALTTGTSAAIRLIHELYTQALERRLADGARIEPGPLSFDGRVGVICRKKDAPQKPGRRRPGCIGIQVDSV